jgi:hypothetical protein
VEDAHFDGVGSHRRRGHRRERDPDQRFQYVPAIHKIPLDGELITVRHAPRVIAAIQPVA